MRLWISWAELKPELLQHIFPSSAFTRTIVTDDRFLSKPSRSIVPRVIDILTAAEADEITMEQVANTIPNIRKNSQKIIQARQALNTYGWDFVQGKRGRNGYQAKFVATNNTSKPKDST
jgi:hypothetical protein